MRFELPGVCSCEILVQCEVELMGTLGWVIDIEGVIDGTYSSD